jgi:hypothetical protein
MNGRTQWLFEAPFVSKSDHYTYTYSDQECYSDYEWETEWETQPLCPGVSSSTYTLRARNLRVPFKNNFEDFRREVERAVGKWTVFRSDQGQRVRRLVEPVISNLRSIHQKNLAAGLRSGALIEIIVNFYYAGKGESLRVCAIAILPPEVINITESRSPRCKAVDMMTEQICQNADKICKLSAALNDAQSRATCERARATCAESRQRGRLCK